MSLDCGRKPENPEGTRAATGENVKDRPASGIEHRPLLLWGDCASHNTTVQPPIIPLRFIIIIINNIISSGIHFAFVLKTWLPEYHSLLCWLYNHPLQDKWLTDGTPLSKLYYVSTREHCIYKQWKTVMDLFPDIFQNSFNEWKCVGIIGDYANKCAMLYSRVCYVVPSLLSEV